MADDVIRTLSGEVTELEKISEIWENALKDTHQKTKGQGW